MGQNNTKQSEKETDLDLRFLIDYDAFGKFANLWHFRHLVEQYFSIENPLIKRSIYASLHQIFCSGLADYATFLTALKELKDGHGSVLQRMADNRSNGMNFPALYKKYSSHQEFLKDLGLWNISLPDKLKKYAGIKMPVKWLEKILHYHSEIINVLSQQYLGRREAYNKVKHGKVITSSNKVVLPDEEDKGFTSITLNKKGHYDFLTVTTPDDLIGPYFIALLDMCSAIGHFILILILTTQGRAGIAPYLQENRDAAYPQMRQLIDFGKSIPMKYWHEEGPDKPSVTEEID